MIGRSRSKTWPLDLPESFLVRLRRLEAAYLQESDPIRQSGFSGGAQRWREEREPILQAVDGDGTFLDVGCANGYLLACLTRWAGERGVELIPYGLDQSSRLVQLAQDRFPEQSFFVSNAWSWRPSMRFRYVYSLYDCVPRPFLGEYVRRLHRLVVGSGGRLILGAYGSKSRGNPAFDVGGFLRSRGYRLAGTATGGQGPITRFAWIERK